MITLTVGITEILENIDDNLDTNEILEDAWKLCCDGEFLGYACENLHLNPTLDQWSESQWFFGGRKIELLAVQSIIETHE
jgi:hypothetical protein